MLAEITAPHCTTRYLRRDHTVKQFDSQKTCITITDCRYEKHFLHELLNSLLYYIAVGVRQQQRLPRCLKMPWTNWLDRTAETLREIETKSQTSVMATIGA